jgi:DNA-directed RNA polymerase specialized sigma24 family protein
MGFGRFAADTMIKLIRAFEAKPSRPVTKTFLYRVASNMWKDRQKRRRVPVEPLRESDENQLSTEEP